MKQLQIKMQEQFDKMCQTGKLFRSSVSGSELWDIYLRSFPNDPVFRDPASSEHNCNMCNAFMRRYGNIVALDANYNIMTIFDVDIKGEYELAVKQLSEALRKASVKDVFFETFAELNVLPYEVCKKTNTLFRLGFEKNHKTYNKDEVDKFGKVVEGKIYTFEHLTLSLPAAFVDMGNRSIEAIMGDYRSDFDVFYRGMMEIPVDTLELVRDLINQNSLLKGTTYLPKLLEMIKLKKQFDLVPADKRQNWCWVNSYKLPYAKFRNELIGTLCVELAEGKELNEACRTWNKRVDPANYMKAVAPITEAQKKLAQKFVEENGYEESFQRRLATLEDIALSEILHVNSNNGAPKVSVFDSVQTSKSTRHKRSEFDKVETISIEKFMKDVLPNCTSVEAFFENKHEGNLVVLTTSLNPESKPMFKWKNNFSWTYNGNLSGKSMIKEQVKTLGGKVDGVLRCSLIWNETLEDERVDLDLWCKEPTGSIGYNTGFRADRENKRSPNSGQLDLDNRIPGNKVAIENIAYSDLRKMQDGKYLFYVNKFSGTNRKGFRAEIEFGSESFVYSYPNAFNSIQDLATVTVKSHQIVDIQHHLTPENLSKKTWGIDSNEFHKVKLMCLSPNHWQDSVGNKEYFFMLEGCQCDQSVRGFHNDNLNQDLLQHRKVLDVLGNTCMIDPTPKHLAGLGFNSTVKDELVVRVKGSFNRMLKIQF